MLRDDDCVWCAYAHDTLPTEGKTVVPHTHPSPIQQSYRQQLETHAGVSWQVGDGGVEPSTRRQAVQ
eukprot:51639-Eustigmatos_ZCMA.PRE.1